MRRLSSRVQNLSKTAGDEKMRFKMKNRAEENFIKGLINGVNEMRVKKT